MNANIRITTDRDVTLNTRGNDTYITAPFDYSAGDAVQLTYHPQTTAAYESIVGKLTDPTTLDNRVLGTDTPGPVVWTQGELTPGIVATVFVPAAVREEGLA